MRVLLITTYFPPSELIAAHRMGAFARYLSLLGCKVTALTTCMGRESKDYEHEIVEVDSFDPIDAVGFQKETFVKGRITSWMLSFYRSRLNERIPSRKDFFFFAGRRALNKMNERGRSFDVVISSYGPPAALLLGASAKKIFGAKWICDYRDLWIENHVYKGLFPFTLLERFLEKKAVSKADLILTVSDPLRDVLAKKFPSIPCKTLENGHDEMPSSSLKKRGDKKTTFHMVYTGTLYLARQKNLLPLFSVLQKLLRDGVFQKYPFRLSFYGSNPRELQEAIKKYSLHEIVFDEGLISHRESLEKQGGADALLFVEEPRPKIDGILTGKLFEYLAKEPPIFGVGITEKEAAGALIVKAGRGVALGEDEAVIEKTLLSFLKSPPYFERNEALIASFSRKQQVERLYGYIRDILHA